MATVTSMAVILATAVRAAVAADSLTPDGLAGPLMSCLLQLASRTASLRWPVGRRRPVAAAALSRGETHDPVTVHGSFINLMKLPNVGPLIFNKVPSNHFMF